MGLLYFLKMEPFIVLIVLKNGVMWLIAFSLFGIQEKS